MPDHPPTVEAYLAAQSPDVRTVLEAVRRAVHDAVPGGEDAISYAIPTLTLDGHPVVHYAGWKHHVSLYPVPEGDEDLLRDLAPYVAGKGTVRFPLAQPVPQELVGRLVTALVAERRRTA